MNSVALVGRLARDPEVKYANEGSTIARFSVAVDRRYKKEGEQQTADFINCIAFAKTAEFIEKWFHKGDRIGLNGHIQTGSYKNKDGNTVYTTDVVVDNVEFVESKQKGEQKPAEKPAQNTNSNNFMNVPDTLEDSLPFN